MACWFCSLSLAAISLFCRRKLHSTQFETASLPPATMLLTLQQTDPTAKAPSSISSWKPPSPTIETIALKAEKAAARRKVLSKALTERLSNWNELNAAKGTKMKIQNSRKCVKLAIKTDEKMRLASERREVMEKENRDALSRKMTSSSLKALEVKERVSQKTREAKEGLEERLVEADARRSALQQEKLSSIANKQQERWLRLNEKTVTFSMQAQENATKEMHKATAICSDVASEVTSFSSTGSIKTSLAVTPSPKSSHNSVDKASDIQRDIQDFDLREWFRGFLLHCYNFFKKPYFPLA